MERKMRWGRRERQAAVIFALLAPTACAVSTQQEVELGQNYAQQLNRQLPLIRDPEVERYINVLGDSLARIADPRGIDYTFYVVNDAAINAFAVPGGFIYVNRGLIERSPELRQLAGVLGHEVAHVVRRHSIKQQQKGQATSVGVTLGCILLNACTSGAEQELINLGAGALFAKFSRADEADADTEGVKYLVRAGIDPRGVPEMFRILLQARQREPGAMEAWFASHPLEEDRIEATSRLVEAYAPAVLNSLTRDTPGFQAFKRRVAAQPPPPAQAQRRGP